MFRANHKTGAKCSNWVAHSDSVHLEHKTRTEPDGGYYVG